MNQDIMTIDAHLKKTMKKGLFESHIHKTQNKYNFTKMLFESIANSCNC